MMRARTSVLAAILVLGATARAAEVRGTAQTLLTGRQDPRAGDTVQVVPLYELLALEVSDLDLPGADRSRVVLQGWGRLQLGDDELNENSADLALLYLDAQRGPLTLKLGRQHLPYGVARMDLVDGLDARLDFGAGFSAQAFGGWAVHPELRHRTDSWLAGGRVAYNLVSIDHLGEVGIGIAQRQQRGEWYRAEMGLDAFTVLGPTHWVGLAVVAPGGESITLVEARLAGTYRHSDELQLTLDGERVAPALFIPRTSIFSVFSNTAHDAYGAEASWTPGDFYRVHISGHALLLDTKYFGYRANLKAVTYREPSHRSLIGAEVRRLDEDDNGYVRGRLLTSLQIMEPLRIAADLFFYRFDAKVNGVDISTIGQLSAVYDVTSSIRLAATVAGGSTPWAKSQVEGMLRFAYGYEVDFAREMGP